MAKIKEVKKEPKSVVSKTSKVVKNQSSNGEGFAIIETGGKQYRVAVGDTIKIEKIKVESKATSAESFGVPKVGDSIVFEKVLLIDNGADVTDIGTPYIDGAKVNGTLIEIGRNKKVIVLKYKQKSRYLKKNGHRQPFFKVQIDKIS